MEVVLQWLDDLDDLIAGVGLISERIRRFFLALFYLAIASLALVAGVLLALRHPPLASATAVILFVTLLYRSVTVPRTTFHQSA